jgi:CelD/BcsL family acetyltransferase involved in cellulose biosynthesis
MSIRNSDSDVRPQGVVDAPSIVSEIPPAAVGRAELTGAAHTAIRLELAGDLAAVEPEWRIFQQQADCTAFQSYDWLLKWYRQIGARRGAIPAIVLGRDSGRALLFIVPLAVEANGPIRRLTWLGADLCDYNAPLLARHLHSLLHPAGFAPLWCEMLILLRADTRFRFDVVDLQKMPERVGGQTNPLRGLRVSPHPSGAYVAELGRDWEAFYAAKRSSATRKKERQQLKRLAGHGEVRYVEMRDRQGRLDTLDALIAQKSRSFERAGVGNMFARPGYPEFYRDLAADPGCAELVHVSRLEVGAEVAAASVGLRFGDSYYLVLSSHHEGELARFGPGRAHLHELLRAAIGGGTRWFDFTVGDEPYKLDWSDIELRLWDHLASVTARGRAAAAAMAVFRRTKRLIKQTPALWRAFNRARMFAAWTAQR